MRLRKGRPPPAGAAFLIDVQDELDELAAALGCLPHLAAMARAIAKRQPVNASECQHDEDEFSAADAIDLGSCPELMAAAVRVRLIRLSAMIGRGKVAGSGRFERLSSSVP